MSARGNGEAVKDHAVHNAWPQIGCRLAAVSWPVVQYDWKIPTLDEVESFPRLAGSSRSDRGKSA